MKNSILFPLLFLCVFLAGCSPDERVVQVAREAADRQAEQNRQMADLQKHVAEGSRRLVEAEAKARGEMTAMQRELQQSQSEVGQQRDRLELERREFADQRNRDPIVAGAILTIGTILACLLPLLLCIHIVRSVRGDAQSDSPVVELLLQEMASNDPVLLPGPSRLPALTDESRTVVAGPSSPLIPSA